VLAIAVRRLLHDRLLTAALAGGIAVATGLGLAVPLVGTTVEEASFQQQIRLAGPAAGITITEPGIRSVDGFRSFAAEATRRVHIDLGDRLGDGASYEVASGFETETLNGHSFSFDVGEARPTAAYYTDLQHHARLVSGSWPADPAGGSIPVLLAAPLAERTGLHEGDVLCLSVPGFTAPTPGVAAETWCARVVGTWAPVDAADPWWGTSPPAASFMLGETGFFAGPGALPHASQIAGHISPVHPDALHVVDSDLVLTGISGLRSYYAVLGNGSVDTSLQSILEEFGARSRIAAFPLQMVAVAMQGIALFFVAFTAAAFLAAQEAPLAVWRGRGWARGRALALLLIELGIAFLVALPVGAAVAGAATLTVAGTPRLSAAAIAAALPSLLTVLATTVGILLVLAALASRRPLGTAARGRAAAPWWQVRKLDLLLALLAAPLLFEARVRGSGEVRQASSGVAADPIAFALPALAIAVVAVASLRLVGPLAGLAARVQHTSAVLATARLRRQGTEHARLGLLLVIAVAVGSFSVAYSATESRAADDRVAYSVGADVRAHYAPDSAAGAPVADLSRLAGVTGSSLVFNEAAGLGNTSTNAQIIGIDPATFPSAAYGAGDLPLDRLTANPDAFVLPGRPTGLAVWILSPGLAVRVTAVVRDAAGQRCTCYLGDLTYSGWKQLQTTLPRAPVYPLRFEALRLDVTPGLKGAAHIALSDLATTGPGAATMSAFTSFDSDRWFSRVLAREPRPDRLYSDMRNPRNGQPTLTIGILDLAAGSVELAPVPQTSALPALAGTGTLADLGLRTGVPVLLRTVGLRDFVSTVGTLDQFPTIYPGQDFVVVDRDSLLRRLAAADNRQALPDELWMRLSQDSAGAVRSLRADSAVDTVVDRSSLAVAAQHDPLRLALEANLLVGFAAALLMAAAGFGLHFLIANRRRSSEYAILRANGLPQATVTRSVLVEQLVMLAYALPVGLAIGLIAAWVLLPGLELGTRPADVFPPATLTIDPLRLAAALVGVAAAALALGAAAGRLARGHSLVDELRSLG